MGAFLFWPIAEGFEPASTSATQAVAKNGKNEYCYLAYSI